MILADLEANYPPWDNRLAHKLRDDGLRRVREHRDGTTDGTEEGTGAGTSW